MAAPRLRYAVVGTGSRAQMYIDAIVGPHAEVAELVAWADTNPGRLDFYEARLPAEVSAPYRFEPGLHVRPGRHWLSAVHGPSPVPHKQLAEQ